MKSLRKASRVLRRECPVGPVRIVTRPLRGKIEHGTNGEKGLVFGYCYHGKRGWVIHIESRQPHFNRIDCLIHEWAHCMAWRAETLAGEETRDHGPLWSLAYGKAYSAIEAAL